MGKKRIKPEIISTTVTEVERGIALCVENTLRFVRNAAILLENKGSDGLAYVLWSLAVEEYGKGILLRQQITKCGTTNGMCRVEFSKDHYEKFTTGLADLKSLKNTKFERLLRVKANSAQGSVTIEDPLRPGAAISVGAAATGLFSDGLDEVASVDPTVDLRFHLLYVAWQQSTMRFVRPGETIRRPELTARWELNEDDLKIAINALRAELEKTGG